MKSWSIQPCGRFGSAQARTTSSKQLSMVTRIRLVERLGGNILGCAFVIGLPELGGRTRLEALGMDVHALCAFEGH